MSDEYFFGLGRGCLTPACQTAAAAVARRHGATFVYAYIPGDGLRYWFAARDRGEPFNGSTARAVISDLDRRGLGVALFGAPKEEEEDEDDEVL